MDSNLKSKYTAVEVVKTSDRGAHLVKDSAGRQAWVMPKSLRADGTVVTATFEKSATKKAEIATTKAEFSAAMQAWRSGRHQVVVSWENEKCIGVDAEAVVTCNDDLFRKLRVFIPKSQVTSEGVQGWMLIAKIEEALAKLQGNHNHLKWMVESVGGVNLLTTIYSITAGGW